MTQASPLSLRFATWKTVKLGTHKSARDLAEGLARKGFGVDDYAADALNAMLVAETETEVELVLVTVADLGFQDRTRRGDIYARAREFDLDLVPAEAGPQLRLQYTDQPMGESIFVGMDPVFDSDCHVHLFHIGDRSWLHSTCGNPNHKWDPHDRWVFTRSKCVISLDIEDLNPDLVLAACAFDLGVRISQISLEVAQSHVARCARCQSWVRAFPPKQYL